MVAIAFLGGGGTMADRSPPQDAAQPRLAIATEQQASEDAIEHRMAASSQVQTTAATRHVSDCGSGHGSG